jgi:glycerate 2-kinase
LQSTFDSAIIGANMDWPQRFHTKSLDEYPATDALKRILAAGIDAANPAAAVRRTLTRTPDLLRFKKQEYLLNNFSALYLVSAGKAAIPMAEAAADILGKYLTEGVVVYKPAPFLKEATKRERDHLAYVPSSHPVPDERSLAAGENILELLSKTTADDLVIFLISGGGSALMTVPVDGVSLADMSDLTSLLLGCGAPIDEINTLRRALDRVKGGGLADAAAPAQHFSLLLSDVVNSPLEAIASGPTVPNPSSNADALAILRKYDLMNEVPDSILTYLKDGVCLKSEMQKKNTAIIGSNALSAEAAKRQAEKEGFFAKVLTTSLEGEASLIGAKLGKMLFEKDFTQYEPGNISRQFCLILGGETTVNIGDAKGLGGRNQEVALAAIKELAGAKNMMLVTLATDGDDGPTDAAGAVVTGETLTRAQALGLDVNEHLRNHDAYPFFDALGDLLKPGMTGTNVNDLTFLFAF